MNNTPDYENNLAFEPKIPVYPYSWGDLVEHCKTMDLFYKEPTHNYFSIGILTFFQDGRIKAQGITIAENRTYEQMKAIITALWEE